MPSATQLLKRDHKKVEGLFNKFEQVKSAVAKKRVADQACQELEIHAQLEEEIFYPAVRKGLGAEDLVKEAKQEHEQAKQIISGLKNISAEDDSLEEKFSELVECIQHHVEEEEGEMLPKVEQSDMDLSDIGEQMADRRKELMRQKQKPQPSPRGSTRKSKSASRRRKSGRAA